MLVAGVGGHHQRPGVCTGGRRCLLRPVSTVPTVRFGFAEHPALPPVFATHAKELSIELEDTSFFLGRETPVPTTRPDLALWREKLFIFMTRNAVSASEYFQIPPRRVVELGTQVEL
jgi:KUP system potassium uptake protein